MTPFDWNDFLTIADRLAVDRGDQTAQRTPIGRANYAAYHFESRDRTREQREMGEWRRLPIDGRE